MRTGGPRLVEVSPGCLVTDGNESVTAAGTAPPSRARRSQSTTSVGPGRVGSPRRSWRSPGRTTTLDGRAPRSGTPNGSRSPLTTSVGTPVSQLVGPATLRPARRVQRERQREDAGRAERDRRCGRPPGRRWTGRRRPAAAPSRTVPRRSRDDRRPGRVELAGGRGRAPAGHPVRLGHPGHGDARRRRAASRTATRSGGVDAAAGAVPEHEQRRGAPARPSSGRRPARAGVSTCAHRPVCAPDGLSAGVAGSRGVAAVDAAHAARIGSSRAARDAGPAVSRSRRRPASRRRSSPRHATSIARRSRGVVAPHTPWQSPTSSAQARHAP